MKTRKNRWISLILFGVLLIGSLSVVQATEEEIRPTTSEYEVTIENANKVFLGNKDKVEWKVGRKYFMTYTVSKVEKNETTQSGVIATKNNTNGYPYLEGGMQYYNQKSVMCDEGWTYFIRFEVLEDGFKTVVSKAKDGESEYIRLSDFYGDTKVTANYYGVWFAEGGPVTATLTHVRCYDESGNNLGIYGKKDEGVMVLDTTGMKADSTVEHSYSFSVENATRLAFGNLRATSDEVVYLEYTVDNVVAKNVKQSGAIMTNQPTEPYPHANEGYLKYANYESDNEERSFVCAGAEYLFRFVRQEDSFDVMVKRTLDGVDTYYSFKHTWGSYQSNYSYVAVWFGDEMELTADFVDVKCYDEDGNNLAIQTNNAVAVRHYGPLEDYTECAAAYYSKTTDMFITLDDERNASMWKNGNDYAEMGTYYIQQAVMYLNIGERKEEFVYTYNAFEDENHNRYLRLKEATVTFMTDVIDGEKINEIKTTAKNGYKVQEPSQPKVEGCKFLGWITGKGDAYDFEQVVLENTTLYAKWEDGVKPTFVGTVGEKDFPIYLCVVTISILLIIGTIIGVVFMNKEKKKNG